ncbi:MAG: hypothetical protein AABY07_07595 [Nanoarchaeota archaeon]
MKYKLAIILLIIIFINSCKLTGLFVKDEPAKKYTIKEEQLSEPQEQTNTNQASASENIKPKDCNQTIKELADGREDIQIQLLELETKKRKLAGEVNYYKDSVYGQEKYSQKLAELEQASDEYKEVNKRLEDQENAIKLLSKKCDIKVRLFRN